MSILVFLLASVFTNAHACIVDYNWQKADVNEDELMFTVLRVNNRPILDSVDVYPSNDTHLVSLSQLPDAFNLAWKIAISPLRFWSQYDEGSILRCTFDINFKSADKMHTALWYADDFDTYIDIRVIANLLAGDVDVNYEIQQLNFTSADASLGLKQKSSSKIAKDRVYIPIETLPLVASEYKPFTLPRINYRADLQYGSKNKKTTSNKHLNAYFDVAYTAAEYRLSSINGGTKQFLRLSKNFLVNDDLANEKHSIETIDDSAVKYEFGDLSTQGDELVSTSIQGLGVNIFSHSQNKRRNFSSVRIEETVLPGWQGKLFRNGQFIAEAETDDNNQIVFIDVTTFFGRNNFEIRLLGPEGQEETRTQIINVGQDQLPLGEFDFRFYAADATKRLLDGSTSDVSDKQIGFSALTGIGHNATISAEVQRQTRADNVIDDYLSVGIDVNLGNHAIRLRQARQMDNGHATFIGINSKFSNKLRGRFEHLTLNDYESNKYKSTSGLQSQTRGSINGTFGKEKPLNASIDITNRSTANKGDTFSVSTSVSHDFMGATLSNKLSYNKSKYSRNLKHDAYWSHRVKNFNIRHSLSWQPFDKGEIDTYRMNIRWPQRLRTFNQSNVEYRANTKNKFTFSHKTNWRSDLFNFQVGGSIDSNGNWDLKLGITGDLFYNKAKRKFGMSRPKGAGAATITALAYLDVNRDSKFDAKDTPISNISFTGRPTWRSQHTSDSGEIELVTTNRYQTLAIDEASLYDPFMDSSSDGYLVSTHEGGTNRVEFPIVMTNDVEGTIIQQRGGNAKGLGGLKVTLLEIDGGNYFSTYTEVDGFFFMSKVPPGKYKLSFDAERLENANLAYPSKEIFIVTPETGDIISTGNIVMRDKSEIYAELHTKLSMEYEGLQKLAFTSLKPMIGKEISNIQFTNSKDVESKVSVHSQSIDNLLTYVR